MKANENEGDENLDLQNNYADEDQLKENCHGYRT